MNNAATLLAVARFFVGFLSVSGFLFGQLFFGTFSLDGTVAGVSGLVAALVGSRRFTRRSRLGQIAILTCLVLVFVGVLRSALDYYIHLNIPGNSFGWFLKGPFLAALVFIAYAALSRADSLFEPTNRNGA